MRGEANAGLRCQLGPLNHPARGALKELNLHTPGCTTSRPPEPFFSLSTSLSQFGLLHSSAGSGVHILHVLGYAASVTQPAFPRPAGSPRRRGMPGRAGRAPPAVRVVGPVSRLASCGEEEAPRARAQGQVGERRAEKLLGVRYCLEEVFRGADVRDGRR